MTQEKRWTRTDAVRSQRSEIPEPVGTGVFVLESRGRSRTPEQVWGPPHQQGAVSRPTSWFALTGGLCLKK